MFFWFIFGFSVTAPLCNICATISKVGFHIQGLHHVIISKTIQSWGVGLTSAKTVSQPCWNVSSSVQHHTSRITHGWLTNLYDSFPRLQKGKDCTAGWISPRPRAWIISSATMASLTSLSSTLTGWATRALGRPVVYEHLPGDDDLRIGAVCVL